MMPHRFLLKLGWFLVTTEDYVHLSGCSVANFNQRLPRTVGQHVLVLSLAGWRGQRLARLQT